MNVTGPDRYSLSFDSARVGVLCSRGTAKFSGLAVSRLPKLYIVSVNEMPVYVGITKQSMRKRLYIGWKAQGATGYYGYAWRHTLTQANLDVWCHENPTADRPCKDVETLEAEVVFLIRAAGQWPLYQTEIHFHPSEIKHREVAAMIAARYEIKTAY